MYFCRNSQLNWADFYILDVHLHPSLKQPKKRDKTGALSQNPTFFVNSPLSPDPPLHESVQGPLII